MAEVSTWIKIKAVWNDRLDKLNDSLNKLDRWIATHPSPSEFLDRLYKDTPHAAKNNTK
jgi:hypothetical protein